MFRVPGLPLCKAPSRARLFPSLHNATSELPRLSWRVDVMSPRPGDTYKSPSAGYGLSPKNSGPYYNISVTLDREALDIVNSWPRGTKSERIRWAIKDRHYGNSPQLREYIDILTASLRSYERHQVEAVIQEKQSVRSTMGRVLALITTLLRRRRGSD